MHTFLKLSAVAIVVLGITAVTSTLTTAYLMRVAEPELRPLAVTAAPVAPVVRRPPVIEVQKPMPVRSATPPALAAASGAPVPAAPTATGAEEALAAGAAPATLDPVVASAPAPTIAPPTEARDSAPAATATGAPATPAPRAAAPVATECDAGGRTWKIAKPGLIGTAVGAGLGAAGGAIANGGKGAGQGAIIGGLAGAALGSGYGAYRTKNECGNVFGADAKAHEPRTKSPVADRETPVVTDRRASAERGAEAPFAAAESDQITIYSVR